MRNRGRSIPYQVIEPILSIPDLAIVSLQLTGDPRLTKAHAQCLADTVAIIDQLDRVIAVDTAIARLASAMGKPVWIMGRKARGIRPPRCSASLRRKTES